MSWWCNKKLPLWAIEPVDYEPIYALYLNKRNDLLVLRVSGRPRVDYTRRPEDRPRRAKTICCAVHAKLTDKGVEYYDPMKAREIRLEPETIVRRALDHEAVMRQLEFSRSRQGWTETQCHARTMFQRVMVDARSCRKNSGLEADARERARAWLTTYRKEMNQCRCVGCRAIDKLRRKRMKEEAYDAR